MPGRWSDAEPGGELNWPSRSRIRRLTHRFVVSTLVLLGDVLARDDRSSIDSSARYRSTHRLTVGHDTWKRAATSLIGHPSSTTKRATFNRWRGVRAALLWDMGSFQGSMAPRSRGQPSTCVSRFWAVWMRSACAASWAAALLPKDSWKSELVSYIAAMPRIMAAD